MPESPAVLFLLHRSVGVHELFDLCVCAMVDLALWQVLEGRSQRGWFVRRHLCHGTVEANEGFSIRKLTLVSLFWVPRIEYKTTGREYRKKTGDTMFYSKVSPDRREETRTALICVLLMYNRYCLSF